MSTDAGKSFSSPPLPFIVAEINKNWNVDVPTPGLFVSQQLEQVINYNHSRGYRLLSFQLHRMADGIGNMSETVIAVFEHVSLRGGQDG